MFLQLICYLSLALPTLFPQVTAVYYPSRPHKTENFDIENANPLGFVTCLGARSDQAPHLPRQGPFDPNTKTLQQICVKPQYGGGLPGQHVGAYCHHAPKPTWSKTVTGGVYFDQTPKARVNSRLANPRMLNECKNRCFCSNFTNGGNPPNVAGPRDTSLQPQYIAGFLPNIYQRSNDHPSSETYQINVGMIDDYNVRPSLHEGTLGGLPVPNVAIVSNYSEIRPPLGGSQSPNAVTIVSMYKGNMIECEGPMPEFPLPFPYRVEDFDAHLMQSPNALTAMCAVVWSGGFRSANAGAYCFNAQSFSSIWFSDEMTPQVMWTWTQNFYGAVAIRYHCKKFCYCKFPEKTYDFRNSSMVNVPTSDVLWDLVDDPAVRFRISGSEDGSINYQSMPKRGPSHSGQILPPQSGPDPAAGTCGVDGKQFCVVPWPSDIAGPIPTAPPMIATLNSGASDASVGRCGTSLTCTSPSDCGGTENSCTCTIPDRNTAKKYGVDPVIPPALCLLMAGLLAASSGGAGKRALEKQVGLNGDGQPWRCLCNATYVSSACCLADDGMIWEQRNEGFKGAPRFSGRASLPNS